MAASAGPYSDPSGELIESLTHEVEYLRLVVSRFSGTRSFDSAGPHPLTRRSPGSDPLQPTG